MNHANCSRTQWECNRSCRIQFVNTITGLCRRPSPHDTCFGIPIKYNYTEPIYTSYLSNYEILSRFPRFYFFGINVYLIVVTSFIHLPPLAYLGVGLLLVH